MATRAIQHLLLCALVAKCASSSYDNNNPKAPPQQWSPPPPLYPNRPEPQELEPERQPQTTWDQARPQYARPESTTHTPIDYQFRSKQAEIPKVERGRWGKNKDVADDIPLTASSNTEPQPTDDPDAPEFSTARQDAVGRYMSTFKGRLALRSSSALVGVAFGGYLGKSLFNTPSVGLATGLLLVLLTFLRNPYGELSRALGLVLIFVWQRTFKIRRRYATWPHIKASLGIIPRRAFPRDDDFQSREISFIYTLIAMGFVGSAVGGNLPFVPTWMGAMGGAGILVFLSTLKSARGDLCRSMGMRLVAVVEEVLDINGELKVVQKSGVVAGRILDKLLILDSKHRIKDRIASGLTFAYNQIASATGRIDRRRDDTDRDEGQRRDNKDDDRRRDSRDDGRRDDTEDERRRGDRDGRRPNDDRRRDDTSNDKRRGDDGRDNDRSEDRRDPRREPDRDDRAGRRSDFVRDRRDDRRTMDRGGNDRERDNFGSDDYRRDPDRRDER